LVSDRGRSYAREAVDSQPARRDVAASEDLFKTESLVRALCRAFPERNGNLFGDSGTFFDSG